MNGGGNDRRWSDGLSSFRRAALDFLYPPACSCCARELDSSGASAGFALCALCRREIAPEIPFACSRCAAPVGPFLDSSGGCVHCRTDRFTFERVYRLGVYDGPLRTVCLRGKEAGGDRLIAAAGELLCDREAASLSGEAIGLVLPIPHHWSQRLLRPHNPAAELARVLARRLKAQFSAHILVKVRRTPAQSRLSPTERRANLRGAFRVRGPAAVRGQTILLADDILTTGTTAHQAARVLKDAGAGRILVAVLARGLGRPSVAESP